MRTETAIRTPLKTNQELDLRTLLAAFWISHFLLWTFGDMLSLLQQVNEPASNNLLLFVAVPLAILQTVMILFSLVGKAGLARWANIGVASLFLIFNIGYLAEPDSEGWNYLLGAAYILFNVLIIWSAWRWPARETDSQSAA